MEWRIIVNGKAAPNVNMAIDEAIYLSVSEGKSPPTIRFYDWQPAAFSYGYHQKIEKELDLEKVRQSPYAYVRRPTGGRVVLHDNEVTYAVIAPITGEMKGSLSNAYQRISEALREGFVSMGIDVELSSNILSRKHQREPNNPCFSSSSRSELLWNRKKIVGSAQVRNNKAFLQHGAILVNNNQSVIADYLPNLNEEERLRIKTYLTNRTITIKEILKREVTYEEVVASFITGFKKSWNEDSYFDANSIDNAEKILVDALILEKYQGLTEVETSV